MRKKLIVKICAVSLALVLMLLSLASCGGAAGVADGEVKKLSFSEANSVDQMKKLDGQKVSIIGYMSTLSPVNGEFMYLMNMPYQSCPFCVPNTTQLSNTLAVYAKDGKSFEFTDLLIRVEGVLEFGDYTDEYGYGTYDNLIEFIKSAEGNFTYVEGDSLPSQTDDLGDTLKFSFTVDSIENGKATITFTKK